MIRVYHATNPTWGFTDSAWPDEYTEVAHVDLEDDNYADAFRLTNTIDSYWWENKGVTPLLDSPAFREVAGTKGTRSTSVGDVIVLSSGKVMRCASAGWTEVE